MPIYEYKCTNCERVQEKMAKVGDAAPPCWICNKETIKVVSQSSFSLKGRGWYKDGYSSTPQGA
ncbi:zinc ribbon domain-containing protein [Candidatus Woesebacteria bacterium]|nr:MAG: zinc ribbon domain-containing protein [Candidatus Woesebacteria bacterium]